MEDIVFEDRLIEAARTCLGTPFHHQGRKREVGLDCIGLVVFALRSAGVCVRDRTDYGVRPEGNTLLCAIEEHGAQNVQEIIKGDLLVFRYDGQPQHVALATDESAMIHAFAPAGKVVETGISPYWRRRIWGIYRFRI